MKNFEKKLEDASEKDLKRWINEHDFRVVPLVSDELTRRRIKELQITIKELDKSTKNYSGKLIDLTVLLFFVALIHILISIAAIPETWLNKVLIFIVVFYAIYLVIRRIEKEKSKN